MAKSVGTSKAKRDAALAKKRGVSGTAKAEPAKIDAAVERTKNQVRALRVASWDCLGMAWLDPSYIRSGTVYLVVCFIILSRPFAPHATCVWHVFPRASSLSLFPSFLYLQVPIDSVSWSWAPPEHVVDARAPPPCHAKSDRSIYTHTCMPRSYARVARLPGGGGEGGTPLQR